MPSLPQPRPTPLPVRPSRATLDDCRLLSIPQVAGALSLSRDSVYDLIHAGTLRAVLLKGKYRVRLTDLAAYVSRLA